MDVALDRETLKALAAPTRVGMLRLLEGRRHTQTELAEALHISVPTAKQHVESLTKAGLVEVFEEGRKWKYCGLTRKAKALLNPEEQRIILTLVLTGLSLAGAAIASLQSSFFPAIGRLGAPAMESALQKTVTASPVLPAAAVTPSSDALRVLLTLALAFGVLAFHFAMRNADARRRILRR